MQPKPQYPPANWNAVPLVPVVLALVTGVLLADLGGFAHPRIWRNVLASLLVVCGATLFYRRPERWYTLLTSTLVLLLAVSFGGWRASNAYRPARADFFTAHQQSGDLLSGTVRSVKPAIKTIRVEVELRHVVQDSSTALPVSGRVLLYVPPEEAAARLRTGDGIVFAGEPDTLRPPLNPGVFDLRAYWHTQHVYHQLYLREDTDWVRLPADGFDVRARAEEWRRAWLKTFRPYLAGDQLAVAAALVLGDRDLISEEIKSAYTDTGAVHVLAVSGLHVGIIFLLVRLILVRTLRLNRLRGGPWVVALLSILAIWAFALVSGFSASVQRSAIMFTILALGNTSRRRGHVFNTLSLAAIVMLVVDPFQLFRVGFQLSFMAIVGIVAFANALNRLLFFNHGLVRKAWSAVTASTGAQLGTLPLALYNFGQFPTYFLISGTVVILSAFGVMFLGVAHGFVAGVLEIDWLAAATGWLLGILVFLQNSFIFSFQGLPYGLWRVPNFGVGPAVALALGIGCLAVYLRWRDRTWLFACLAFVFLTVIWARTQVPTKLNEHAVALYHLNRQTLLDLTAPDGRTWSLGQQPLPGNLGWSAGPRRQELRLVPAATFALSNLPDSTLAPGLTTSSAGFSVSHSSWYIIDGDAPKAVPDTLPAGLTHLLITNNFRPDQFPQLSGGDLPLLLIDGSSPRYRYDAWRARADKLGVQVWITAERGAYLWPAPQEQP